jgi:hypothetical protein
MNGTNLQFFVDGTNVASAVGNGFVNWAQDSGGASTGLNMLGQEQDKTFGINDLFNGMISEFRLWTKALTQGEIQNNMNKQLVPALHPELVGYWTMAQGSGSTVSDMVSSNNTLTLYGNAGWTNDAPPITQDEGTICTPHKATATAQLVNGFVVGVTITDPGCGYTNAPAVLIQGGGGTGATATAVVSNGVVVNIVVTDAGSGYTSAPSIYIYSPLGLQINLKKAVKPTFSDLLMGTNYQLQLSGNLNTWTNHGAAFTATNSSMVYPQYWDVDDWGCLFFRLQSVP